ncbi:hypothetical protein EDB19DRAFT_1825458 [Suillus lakei]|nr:hypothetical protein EDB19DRAFT_1825458 [Suillus lakei]
MPKKDTAPAIPDVYWSEDMTWSLLSEVEKDDSSGVNSGLARELMPCFGVRWGGGGGVSVSNDKHKRERSTLSSPNVVPYKTRYCQSIHTMAFFNCRVCPEREEKEIVIG